MPFSRFVKRGANEIDEKIIFYIVIQIKYKYNIRDSEILRLR